MKSNFLPLYIIVIIALASNGCTGQTFNNRTQNIYNENKSKFDQKFVSHFPPRITTDSSTVVRKQRNSLNDVGLYLYEYHVSDHVLDSIENFLSIRKSIVKYGSGDSCLLVVNSLTNTSDNEDERFTSDSLVIMQDCYNGVLPIPKFTDFETQHPTSCMLDTTFRLYVLEAKSGRRFQTTPLEPLNQMPSKWKNGYSKGIAISKQNNALIYWSIMW